MQIKSIKNYHLYSKYHMFTMNRIVKIGKKKDLHYTIYRGFVMYF